MRTSEFKTDCRGCGEEEEEDMDVLGEGGWRTNGHEKGAGGVLGRHLFAPGPCVHSLCSSHHGPASSNGHPLTEGHRPRSSQAIRVHF